MRLFLLGSDLPDSTPYDTHYIPEESFLRLEIESGKQVPFLRIHRDNIGSNESEDADNADIGQKETPSILDGDVLGDRGDEIDKMPFIYIFPPEYYDQVSQGQLLEAIYSYLKIPSIERTIQNLSILLFPEDAHTRGRMFRERIYLYSLERIPQSEVLSVFIHEFGHYHDIHGLIPTRFGNLSERFYDISWSDTDIIRAGQGVSDFVSGYAMTNKYEDFAETYTYFVLHNAAFREKMSSNPILRQKYNFFETYIFPQKEFYKRNFSTNTLILPYYWDITKIEIDIEKFLQYIYLYL